MKKSFTRLAKRLKSLFPRLPSVWEELSLLPQNRSEQTSCRKANKHQLTQQHFKWRNEIDYKGHKLNWVEGHEEVADVQTGEIKRNRFVHLTNLTLNRETAPEVSNAGRLRWKIENEGFNTQKNNGYNLGHKFSRVSFQAMKYDQNQLNSCSEKMKWILAELLHNETKLWESSQSFLYLSECFRYSSIDPDYEIESDFSSYSVGICISLFDPRV